MKNNARQSPHGKTEEMVGLWELGLLNEALAIALKILSSGSFDEHEFVAALAVILDTESPGAHENLVTTAYAKLSKAGRQWASCKVFQFYDQIGKTEIAVNYIPRDYVESGNLLQSMWALLKLRRFKQARRIFRVAERQLKKAAGDYERSNLLAAMAEYYAHIGKLDEAERHWLLVANYNQPVFASAVLGLVKIQAAKGLRFVKLGLAATEEFARQDRQKMPMADRLDEAAKKLTKQKLDEYRQTLLQIVPEEDLWRFGKSHLK